MLGQCQSLVYGVESVSESGVWCCISVRVWCMVLSQSLVLGQCQSLVSGVELVSKSGVGSELDSGVWC